MPVTQFGHNPNRLYELFGSNAGNPAPPPVDDREPILQAADIQAEALENAIPYFEPFYDMGLAGAQGYASAATPQGLDEMISQIMSGDYFTDLVDTRTRAVQGQLAASGLTRSGRALEEAAAIPTELAFNIENLLTGRQGSLGDMGFSSGSQIADLTTRVGEAIASGILGLEAQENARDMAGDTNRSNLLGSVIGGTLSGGLFSDPSLKQNIRTQGKIGPLTLVEWDWIPEAKGTLVENCPTIGFMAPDVKEHYPDLVSEFGGYQVIDYPNLIERLECR